HCPSELRCGVGWLVRQHRRPVRGIRQCWRQHFPDLRLPLPGGGLARWRAVAAGGESAFRRTIVTGSLHGLRVVEVGHLIAGPFCGHLFDDHGAEVIKVESPGDGDIMRKWGGIYKGIGLYWPILSRQKKS